MKIAVTGGAGFIGQHLVRALSRRGHALTVLDNLRRGSFETAALEGATLIQGDIRDSATCDAAFRGVNCVVHLAAQSNVMGSESDPSYTVETNVSGTWTVAQAATAAGVPHLLFASSREVYGEPQTVPVPEAAPFSARNLYGATKISGEALLGTFPNPQLRTSILRLSNVIGPGDTGRVVPLWLTAARAQEPLILYGGEQVLDFVPVELVVDAFVAICERGPIGAPVNVGSGLPVTLRELAGRIIAMTGSRSTLEVRPARGPEVSRYCADVSRMERCLGLTPPADAVGMIARWAVIP